MTDIELAETLRAIKAEFRSAMNGVAANHIRQSGMGYRMAFGIELPRLQEIAAQFQPDARIAQALWDEDVRESRIMATMLHPVNLFYEEIADIWVERLSMEQSELAGILVLNLLSKTPYASTKAFCWIASEQPIHQLLGFLLISRLFIQGAVLNPSAENEFLDQVATALHAPQLPLRRAARNAVLHYPDQSILSSLFLAKSTE